MPQVYYLDIQTRICEQPNITSPNKASLNGTIPYDTSLYNTISSDTSVNSALPIVRF